MRDIIREAQANNRDEGDLLSMLIQARDEAGRPMSEAQLLDECTTLMFAGHETTAVALMWAWLLLARHPEAAGRLYDEVDERLKGGAVTFERLTDLPYTEMIVKETLRLYPPAYSFGRTPLEAIDLEAAGRRYHFKKGSTIIISTMAMHRLPEFFPQPEAFRPERWAAGEPQPPKYAYLPFGAGPRVCLGNMFAMMEAQVILATMAQGARFVPEGEPEMKPEPLLTLRPKGPLRFCVTLR
jgi:cytochrome P450